MVCNLATQGKLAVGKTEKQSDLCHTVTKMFRNCQYQALVEINSEVRFVVNVPKTH